VITGAIDKGILDVSEFVTQVSKAKEQAAACTTEDILDKNLLDALIGFDGEVIEDEDLKRKVREAIRTDNAKGFDDDTQAFADKITKAIRIKNACKTQEPIDPELGDYENLIHQVRKLIHEDIPAKEAELAKDEAAEPTEAVDGVVKIKDDIKRHIEQAKQHLEEAKKLCNTLPDGQDKSRIDLMINSALSSFIADEKNNSDSIKSVVTSVSEAVA
jgi:hypothetical protein